MTILKLNFMISYSYHLNLKVFLPFYVTSIWEQIWENMNRISSMILVDNQVKAITIFSVSTRNRSKAFF